MIRFARALALLVLVGTTTQATAVAAEGFATREQLRPGVAGIALTALEGREIREIPVSYLGTLDDFVGPGYDVHLFQLEGPVAEQIGVAAGMSGSPVYVDGRLVGALSYRLGSLPKQAIAGVTPIEDILRSSPSGRGPSLDPTARRIRTPVAVSGLHPEVREWLAPRFEELGLTLVAGGKAGGLLPSLALPWPPDPPVGVGLVRGDLTMAATGTVTWIDGDRVFAFGHPFFGAGRTELPMHRATVIHTLADMLGPVKLSRVDEEVGAIVEDRLSAIVGRLGAQARMIPVELTLRGADYGEQPFRFEIARDRTLTPLLVGSSLANALVSNAGYSQRATLFAKGRLRLADLPDVPFETVVSGESSGSHAIAVALRVVQLLAGLSNNPFSEVEVLELQLEIEASAEVRSYVVESLIYDRGPVAPGETFEVGCVLRRQRGETEVHRLQLVVPPDLGDRSVMLVVGSQASVQRALGHPLERRRRTATSVRALVRALGETRSEDRLGAVLYAGSRGVVSEGEAYEALPLSARHLLSTSGSSTARRGGAEVLAAVEARLDGPVSGGIVIRLELEPKPD